MWHPIWVRAVTSEEPRGSQRGRALPNVITVIQEVTSVIVIN